MNFGFGQLSTRCRWGLSSKWLKIWVWGSKERFGKELHIWGSASSTCAS